MFRYLIEYLSVELIRHLDCCKSLMVTVFIPILVHFQLMKLESSGIKLMSTYLPYVINDIKLF